MAIQGDTFAKILRRDAVSLRKGNILPRAVSALQKAPGVLKAMSVESTSPQPSNFNQAAANSVTNQTSCFMHFQLFHNTRAVRLCGFSADIQQTGDFLCGIPLSN